MLREALDRSRICAGAAEVTKEVADHGEYIRCNGRPPNRA